MQLGEDGWSRRRTLAGLSRMDSYRTYLATGQLSGSWLEDQDEDIYEVESRVPLPYPYSLSEHLDDSNSVIISTSVFHFTHKRSGHIVKLVSKISLPTPPYSVSTQQSFRTVANCSEMGTSLSILRGLEPALALLLLECCCSYAGAEWTGYISPNAPASLLLMSDSGVSSVLHFSRTSQAI